MAISNLPTKNEIHQPILDLLSDGKEHRWSDIVEKLAAHFSLTNTELNEEVPSGHKRFYHRCSFAMQDLKKDGFVESPKRAHWKITKRGNDHQKRQNRIPSTEKETRENPLRAPSKTLPSSVSVPNPIRRESTKDKNPIIRTRSRSRSYGKKLAERPGQKQRAIERARVRDVETIEPVQEPKPPKQPQKTTAEKRPWRGPRAELDPGTYACRTVTSGVMGCITLPFAILAFYVDPFVGLYFSILPIASIIGFIQSIKKSRGGW